MKRLHGARYRRLRMDASKNIGGRKHGHGGTGVVRVAYSQVRNIFWYTRLPTASAAAYAVRMAASQR